ncbi:hypothetical protein P3T26_000335 [Streptomyces sp. MAA16]|nr:hypothetical protein [Streptomyces sp. MAA16]
MVRRTMGDLGPAGAHSSRDALLARAKGLVLASFDDREPAFTDSSHFIRAFKKRYHATRRSSHAA